MRPDGLSSTALNRGLHLHESRALLFLLSPLFLSPIYFFFQGGSSVASYHEISWGAERKLGRPTEIYGRHSVTAALPLSSSCMLLSQRLSSHKWEGERVEYTKGEIQPQTSPLRPKCFTLSTITLSCVQSLELRVSSLSDHVSVICVKVPELYSLDCGVFYLQHPWPGLPGPLSIISTRDSGRAGLPPLPSTPTTSSLGPWFLVSRD